MLVIGPILKGQNSVEVLNKLEISSQIFQNSIFCTVNYRLPVVYYTGHILSQENYFEKL